MIRGIRVAVVGATGLVGRSLIECLEKRRFPLSEAVLFSSPASEGRVLHVNGRTCRLAPPTQDRAAGFDLAFFAVPPGVSRELAPHFVKGGAVVIDLSGAWSLDPGTPLVVPEVVAVGEGFRRGIIASPSAPAIPLALALKPLLGRARVRGVTATFSLPVGGRGKKALADFEDAIRVAATVPRPDWERLNSSRSGAEEPRLAEEVRKILGDASLRIDAWCGEVPCPRGIEGNVSVDTEPPVPVEEALERFRGAPGLRLREGSPAPGGGEGVEVGPVRAAGGGLSGLRFGITCDNLLKGSALNAVQIAEQVFKI